MILTSTKKTISKCRFLLWHYIKGAWDARINVYSNFAVARTVGWISQWKEMTESLNKKISRPRQLYTGKIQRQFVEIGKRKNSKKMYPGEIT